MGLFLILGEQSDSKISSKNLENYISVLVIILTFIGILAVSILKFGFYREFNWGCAGIPLFGPYFAINLRLPLEIISISSFSLAIILIMALIINYFNKPANETKKDSENSKSNTS